MRSSAHSGADVGHVRVEYIGRHWDAPGGPRHLTVGRKVLMTVQLVLEIVAIVIIIDLILGMYMVPSESMEPTMYPGEVFIGERARPFLHDLHRGDVVVFHDDDGWMDGTPHEGQRLVKRIIGMPGDRVTSTDGVHLTVNDLPVDESAWVSAPSAMIPFDVTVPDGRIWVMGDNRSRSADSRLHMDRDGGTVSEESVEAVVLFRVYPFDAVGAIHGHGKAYLNG